MKQQLELPQTTSHQPGPISSNFGALARIESNDQQDQAELVDEICT